MADGPNLRLTSDRIDALVDELTSVPDRRVATKVEELLSLLLELQGVALGRIVEVVDRWWGGPIHAQVHPIFFYELGDYALVVEEGGLIIGFLLGFVATNEVNRVYPATPGAGVGVKTGYVHLVGIHPEYRRRGVGRLLYKDFIRECVTAGCTRMKAITGPPAARCRWRRGTSRRAGRRPAACR